MKRVLVDLDDACKLFTSQAKQNLEIIEAVGKLDAFYNLVDETFNDGVKLSEIDDYVKYELDTICDSLGIDLNESVNDSFINKINNKLREALQGTNKSLKEEYEAGDSVYLTIEHIKDNLYELDGVQFYKGEDEELQNAVEVCIDEDYLNTWIKDSDDEVTGYWVQSFEYDEESGTGEVEVVLE